MDAASSGMPLIFDNFVIYPREQQLRVDGQPVKIGMRAFELLMVLVERNGHLVSKDELLELVWPKMVVEENTLQVHISALRKLLGPDVIVTVPGRGYRFAAIAKGQTTPSAAQEALPMELRGSAEKGLWKVAALGALIAVIAGGAWLLGKYTDTSQLKETAGTPAPPGKSIAVLRYATGCWRIAAMPTIYRTRSQAKLLSNIEGARIAGMVLLIRQ
jgi:DNA-binding winged helix-turn-helix (wHTH) protein